MCSVGFGGFDIGVLPFSPSIRSCLYQYTLMVAGCMLRLDRRLSFLTRARVGRCFSIFSFAGERPDSVMIGILPNIPTSLYSHAPLQCLMPMVPPSALVTYRWLLLVVMVVNLRGRRSTEGWGRVGEAAIG